MQIIETKVIQLKQKPGIDPFSVYRRSVEQFGEYHAFLAESLSGPLADCQQSIVAIHRVGSISLRADSVKIEANSTVAQHLIKTIEAAHESSCKFDATGLAKIESPDQLWAVLRTLLSSCYHVPDGKNGADISAGFVARIDYDAAALIEKIPRRLPRSEATQIRLDIYQYFAVFREENVRLYVNHAPGFGEPDIPKLMGIFRPLEPFHLSPIGATKVSFSMSKNEYIEACRVALKHIHAGNIYQVQLGHEINIYSAMAPIALYANLRASNPSPYMFFYRNEDMDLIGSSPESFVRLERHHLSMRPIAGTLAKSSTVSAQILHEELRASVKENAEHVMLVDLCRNDVGRLCEPGTLEVPSLMELEAFPSLYHLVSTVSGTLHEQCDVVDVLRATFPAGTMVGAPKIRAMEIIEHLEQSPRGPYAGAIGMIGFNGSMNMALCIRMACHYGGEYRIRASAGIVFDSEPEREWQETLTKMRLLYRSLTGTEIDQ